jgi:hypothetical protein
MADQYPPAAPPSSESELPPRKRRRWPWIVGAVVAVGVLVLVVEGFIRRHEMDAVLDQVEDAERVSIAGETG